MTDDVDRVIGRAIVNDDRLPIRCRLADQRIKRARQVSCAVVGADDDAEEEDGQCNSCHVKIKKGRKRWEEEDTGKQFCKKCVRLQVNPKLFAKAEEDPEFKIMKKIISKS